ncbi:hypothetical protein RhiirC2_858762 [Rhizophagus irregularis]|uniref:Uncharacterized protein n=1 Tax=Rhizophagus irregularis TaxID=588596 RepID=A0A2N1M368_9GLOM|nr:hypothetical protein RhiirC2_858762 [Rhizophagus irregularis]
MIIHIIRKDVPIYLIISPIEIFIENEVNLHTLEIETSSTCYYTIRTLELYRIFYRNELFFRNEKYIYKINDAFFPF